MIGENVDCVAWFVVFVADMEPVDWRVNVDCVAMFVVFVADMEPDDWRECRLCCDVCCLCRRHGAG